MFISIPMFLILLLFAPQIIALAGMACLFVVSIVFYILMSPILLVGCIFDYFGGK